MGFESCHPAVNFIFFAAALYGTVCFNHPVFLAAAYISAFAYSVRRCGKRAVAFNLCLLPLILAVSYTHLRAHETSQDQPAAVPIPHDPAATHSQNRSGGKENQPRPKGNWLWQQSGQCLSAVCQLPADILHADYVDDFGVGAGIRFHAFTGQSAPGKNGFLYLPFRQPGSDVCDLYVLLCYVNYNGYHPGCYRHVV